MRTIFLLPFLLCFSATHIFSQDTSAHAEKKDTFFLAKQKGLLGKIGKTMSGNDDLARPDEKTNPFLIYTGKTIRSIKVEVLGFERDINDTFKFKRSFGTIAANALHKNTTLKTAKRHLFFYVGDKLNPYLLADNERFLRDQVFIQDALIIVKKAADDAGAVDLIVLVKDVFSLGGSVGAGNLQKFRFEVKEENLAGVGTKLAFNTLYDNIRDPRFGVGAELVRRNIRGSFINWSMGFRNYRDAFNNGRSQENIYYMRFDKPLVSQYLPWMGSLELSYNKTGDHYPQDTNYLQDFRYSYYNVDGWIAYNFGAKRSMYKNLKSTARKFAGVRMYNQHFINVPGKALDTFNASYADIKGILGSFSIFKQNFYRTNYIYGFGRNEDVPQGFSASIIGGYTMRQDSLNNKTRSRPYFGFDGQYSKYNDKGFYSAYTFRFGGYRYKGGWEDVALLLNVEHFTRLRQINEKWFRRFFFNGGITRQFSPKLDEALKLRSSFGLPYFGFGYDTSDLRITAKSEMVFYHTHKFWGFRFAPFAFTDAILLKPTNQPFSQADLFGAIGVGLRTRNENLVFGTIEMRCFYFPRVLPGMSNLWIKFNTNLRFRYNSTFIRRPDFVTPN